MYKTNNKVTLYTFACNPEEFVFDDSVIEGSGTAALASLLANKPIKSVVDNDGQHMNVLINKYEFAMVETERVSADAPEDDNCKSGDNPEPTATDFVIRNISPFFEAEVFSVAVSGNHIGTFGDITFAEYDSEEDVSYSTEIITIAGNGYLTISDLPAGTSVYVDSSNPVGTVPGSYDISGNPDTPITS